MALSDRTKRNAKRGGTGLLVLVVLLLCWVFFLKRHSTPEIVDAYGHQLPTKADSVEISKKDYTILLNQLNAGKDQCKGYKAENEQLKDKVKWLSNLAARDSVSQKNLLTRLDSALAKFTAQAAQRSVTVIHKSVHHPAGHGDGCHCYVGN